MQITSSVSDFVKKHAFTFGVIGLLFMFPIVAASFVVANGQTITPTDSHIVSLYINGQESIVPTRAKTVGELVDKTYQLNKQDLIEPARETPIDADNFKINVYKARPVTIIDGPTTTRVMSPYQSEKLIAEKAGLTVYPEDTYTVENGTSFVEEHILGQKITIDRAVPVFMTIFGKSAELRTQAVTVGDLLKEKAIALGPEDKVSVTLDAAITPGMTVDVWREGKQTVSQEEVIKKPIKKISDTNKPIGYTEVQIPGKDGKKLVTYEVEIRNGAEYSRKEITTVITEQPVEEVVIVGARNNYSSNLNEWLHALRQCESGGIYTRNTANGFYGAYQFMIGTWDRIARKIGRADLIGVRPDLANPADQDMMIVANTKLSSQGLASQNPGCYKKLGLSQFPPE